VRYLIADPCHLGDEDLDFVQHAVCDCGKFVERMIEPRDRNTSLKLPDMMRRTRAFRSVTRLFTGVLAAAIGVVQQRVRFQCKYFPARTSAPKCSKQYLMAELKPPSHVVFCTI